MTSLYSNLGEGTEIKNDFLTFPTIENFKDSEGNRTVIPPLGITSEGDALIGVFIRSESTPSEKKGEPDKMRYFFESPEINGKILKKEDGSPATEIIVFGNNVLNDKMRRIISGDIVKITYLGLIQSEKNKGFHPYKNFKVVVFPKPAKK